MGTLGGKGLILFISFRLTVMKALPQTCRPPPLSWIRAHPLRQIPTTPTQLPLKTWNQGRPTSALFVPTKLFSSVLTNCMWGPTRGSALTPALTAPTGPPRRGCCRGTSSPTPKRSPSPAPTAPTGPILNLPVQNTSWLNTNILWTLLCSTLTMLFSIYLWFCIFWYESVVICFLMIIY